MKETIWHSMCETGCVLHHKDKQENKDKVMMINSIHTSAINKEGCSSATQ